MNYKLTFLFWFLLVPLAAGDAAELELASVFSDHMVLQRGQAVPVWGAGDAGEAITVEFAGQKQATTADETGRWMVQLDSMLASGESRTLMVRSGTSGRQLEVTDVLVGEVWLASGQSNMEWEMQSKEDSRADLPSADHPQLRLLEVPRSTSLRPQQSFDSNWAPSTPESAASFSCVGYYFGLRLHEQLKVPVGVIQSAWGGTRIEPWTSLDGFDAVEVLRDQADDIRKRTPGSDAYRRVHEAHLQTVKQWTESVQQSLERKQPVPVMPRQPDTLSPSSGAPTALYNAMIHPLVPYAIAGAIWYQGESNHNDGMLYVDKTRALLASWRGAFQSPDLPFYFVQIAPYQYGTEDPEILARFWAAQRECLRIPHVGMAVISDIGEIADIHPGQKKEVARRLSLWALANTYDRGEIDPSGPLYADREIDGDAIRVRFDHAGGGLVSRDEKPLTDFEIAGIDGQFHSATATIDGESIVVRSPDVLMPRQVRFAWSKLAMPNLVDRDGLPACAFHTHWPVDPDLGENLARGCEWQTSDENTYGWNVGLTDGSWGNRAPQCFATGLSKEFPKTVTIDLRHPQVINLVRFGVPDAGSTKTVAVSISRDGKEFQEVGVHAFGQGVAERTAIVFGDTATRYVRLTYQDHYPEQSGGYNVEFAFTTEVEVYRAEN